MSRPVNAFAGDDYVSFCDGIRRLTGIDLQQYKRPQMERRIRSLADRRGHSTLPAYLARLQAEAALLDEFLDRVTINVSQLWRNPEQWERLSQTILPELGRRGRISAWSAGCSYGAEAYTVAGLSRQVAPSARLEVLGTDIDRRMVSRARGGRFSEADARTAPPQLLTRWFERDQSGWRAKPELRMVTRFDVGDLLNDPTPVDRFDLVLCRNVVIYFTEAVRDQLHERLARSLRPGGYLMIGSSERVSDAAAMGLESTHPFIYRRGLG